MNLKIGSLRDAVYRGFASSGVGEDGGSPNNSVSIHQLSLENLFIFRFVALELTGHIM